MVCGIGKTASLETLFKSLKHLAMSRFHFLAQPPNLFGHVTSQKLEVTAARQLFDPAMVGPCFCSTHMTENFGMC